MARVQHSDADAFEQLYDRYSARAHGVARAICPHPETAEEAVQEAFIAIWRNATSYQPSRGEVSAWMMGIVRNRAIDVARRHTRHDQRRDDAVALEREQAAVDVDADALAADDARRLRRLLATLPPAQREVITLAFYGQLTHSEIAAHLQLPAGTVKGRMRLGLQQLRSFQ